MKSPSFSQSLIKSTLTVTIASLAVLGSTQASANNSKIKNVIVMIGDGMGPQQIGLFETYVQHSKNPKVTQSAFQRLSDKGVIGIVRTEPHNALVVDSAAAATQFASGKMAGSEMVGTDYEGNKATTMLEIAQQKGKAVGLVSDTRLTHATPASFASHQPHRKYENEIAEQMLDTNVDVMLSGGLRHWIPKSANDKDSPTYKQLESMTQGNIRIKSKRKDEKDLLIQAHKQGYELSFDRKSLKRSDSKKLLGLYSYSGMADGIKNTQTKNDPNRVQPTLKEMTDKAISILEKDKDGFFLMVEGGQIDWASHSNDTGTTLHEMVKFSDSINSVLDWMKDRDDTLLIVSADHETGGLGFAYSRNDLPKGKKLNGDVFKGKTFKPNFNFGKFSTLDKLYAQKASYYDIFSKFDKLDKEEQTAKSLMKLVNENTQFPITLAEAERVLETEDNNYRVKGHKYLDVEKFPRINDREEFYVYGDSIRQNLLAMVTAKYSNAVWSTDNHTATPVYVFAYGPEQASKRFGTMQHSTDWANKVIDLMK